MPCWFSRAVAREPDVAVEEHEQQVLRPRDRVEEADGRLLAQLELLAHALARVEEHAEVERELLALPDVEGPWPFGHSGTSSPRGSAAPRRSGCSTGRPRAGSGRRCAPAPPRQRRPAASAPARPRARSKSSADRSETSRPFASRAVTVTWIMSRPTRNTGVRLRRGRAAAARARAARPSRPATDPAIHELFSGNSFESSAGPRSRARRGRPC